MDFEDTIVWSRVIGLILFMSMFVVFCAWAYRPGGRKAYEDAGRIPFRAPEEKQP